MSIKRIKLTEIVQIRMSPGMKKELERYAFRKSTSIGELFRQFIIKMTDYEETEPYDQYEPIQPLPIKGMKKGDLE